MGCFWIRLGQCKEECRLWKEKERFVYQFAVGGRERRRGLEVLTLLMLFFVCAL